ncbi:MAG: hypothetical protein AABW48_01830 [Nanoarchaeota archaeon]
MNLVKTVKEGLKLALGLTALNQGLVAICFPAGMQEYRLVSDKLILNERKLNRYDRLPEDFSTLDYLNLANSLVESELQEKKLSQKSDCKDFATRTYDVYQDLINLNHRTDLNGKVSIIAGLNGMEGHALLEYEEFNKAIPYETTAYTPPLNIDEVKDYSQQSKGQKTRGLKTILVKSTRSGNFFYPTLESVYVPGGLLWIAGAGVYKELNL